MSEPFGPDDTGDGGQEENPEPEEDSDWSQGVKQDVENVELSSYQPSVAEQGEDPEDISCETGAVGGTHCVSENGNEQGLSESEPQVALLNGVSSSSVAEEDENGREEDSVPASLVEGDSFEQDEVMAAPECENDAIQQACIESDQQLLLPATKLPDNEASHSIAVISEGDAHVLEDNGGNESAANVFSGDVGVDISTGVDAPEDDIRIEQDEISLVGESSNLEDNRRPLEHEESPSIESQRMNDTSLDVERDSQIPECDRKDDCGGFNQSVDSDSRICNDAQRDQSVSESMVENVIPEQSECINMEVNHSEILDSHNSCGPTDFLPNPSPQSHSSEDQSSKNNEDSSESEISRVLQQDNDGNSRPCSSPISTPSHSNSKFDHSNNSPSPPHQPSEHNNPSRTSPQPSDESPPKSTTTLLSVSSPEVIKKPSSSHQLNSETTIASNLAASSISTECFLSPPRAVNNHSPVAATKKDSTSKNSQSNDTTSFHANTLSHQESIAIQIKQKAASSSFSQSKANSALESPDDYYQKQLALALSKDDDDDELDDIMSELDAELLSRSRVSPQRGQSRPSSNSSQPRTMTQSQGKNGKLNNKVPNGLVGDTEYRQLQDHNRQMLEQLKIRDDEIKKLYGERDSSRAELMKLKSDCQETLAHQTSSSHNADDLYLPQIKVLENTIAQQQKEIQATKGKLISHDTAAKRAVTTLQNELKIRVDQITRQYEEAVKEKDSMVVMFASSESRVMESKKASEKAENRLREAIKEKDGLITTLKNAKMDKQKAVNGYEQKCSELGDVKREMEKLKEALSSADYRIKWFQNKLKEELEAHKETKANLDKTTSKLKETKEETEIIRRECQAIVKTYQESEEIKSNSLDKELKMKESQLKLQMQEWSDNQEIHQKTKKELESLKVQHKEAVLQVNTLKEQVQSLEISVAEKDSAISQSNELLNKQKADITGIHSKLKEKQNLDEDYNRAQEMIKSLDKDVSELKVSNRDLQKDMESCRERESKMLSLQSELSRTNACLRSENTTLSNKATNLTAEVERLKMEIQELETTVKHLTDSVEDEKKNNAQTIVKLKASLEEKTKESCDLKQKWEDEIDSNKTLKRRHANNVKDLTRQLQQAKRRLEMVEGNRKDSSGSMGSRTNSNGSLNSMVDTNQAGGVAGAAHHHHNAQHGSSTGTSSANTQEFPVITEQVEIDKQVLIERIVRLQKSHARKNEKLEFLGEHIQQLLEEIKKKTKIIQSYVMREEAGTLSSEDMDANKSLLSRKGGIMASMYSQHQQDGNMTLELSLQINKKLQAVLEDTLLKNITLKENLDTLGEEIARLSQVNRKLQLHLQDLENQKKH